MRSFLAFVVIIYLVGVIVALAPAIGAKWSAAPASDLAANALQELPNALAWPTRVYRILRDQMAGPPKG